MHAYAAVLIIYLPNKHVWTMNKIRYETTSYTPHVHIEECGLLQKVRKYPLHGIYMLNSFSCQKNVNKAARDLIL